MDIPQAVADRFWSKVDKQSDCWLWTKGVDQDGYGQFMHQGRNYRAHRFARILAGDPVPSGMVTRHLCNTPACVRPSHTIAGTQAENVQDQVAAGTHARLKFTDEQRAEVREAYAAGGETTRSLAARFGISKSHVHAIVAKGNVA